MSADESTKNEIIQKLVELENRISALEGRALKKTEAEGKKLSVREFLLAKKPTDNVQRTLIIGYYLEHFDSLDSFNGRDLTDGFRSAKEPVPANINDKVNMNIHKGHIMEAKEKKDNSKAWVLTNSGEKFVEEALPGGE